MARTKTVSQNISLFCSDGGATTAYGTNIIFPILNLTSLDCGWSQEKQDVVALGKLASRTRIPVNSPEVPLSFSYYIGGGSNEALLGFYSFGDQSALKFMLESQYEGDKNYFIFIAPEGADSEGLSGASSGVGVIGIGNGFLSSYSIEGSIGNFPTANVSVIGLNMNTYTGGVNQVSPAVNPIDGTPITGFTFTIPTVLDNQGVHDNLVMTSPFLSEPYCIRPGDISIDISNAGGLFYNYSSADIQSFRVGFDLNRQPLNKLGSRFSISQEIQYPVNVNFETTILAKDLNSGSLSNFLCQTGLYDARIRMNYNTCGTGATTEAFGIRLKNISLEGQSWSTQAGSDPQTVTLTWVGQVGGPGDLQNGLFLSGYVPLNN